MNKIVPIVALLAAVAIACSGSSIGGEIPKKDRTCDITEALLQMEDFGGLPLERYTISGPSQDSFRPKQLFNYVVEIEGLGDIFFVANHAVVYPSPEAAAMDFQDLFGSYTPGIGEEIVNPLPLGDESVEALGYIKETLRLGSFTIVYHELLIRTGPLISTYWIQSLVAEQQKPDLHDLARIVFDHVSTCTDWTATPTPE